MIIKNGNVLNDSFEFSISDLYTEGEKISKITVNENFGAEKVIDAGGCYVVPGFIDTHFHGALGKTFMLCEEDSFKKAAQFEAQNGTTSIIPATSGATMEKQLEFCTFFSEIVRKKFDGCAMAYGVHFEGPFLNEKRRGGFLPKDIRKPTVELFMKYYEILKDSLKIMTVAPDADGALDVIKKAEQLGVHISLGHTEANLSQVKSAVEAGAGRVTHMFNAMKSLHHRDPGTVGAFLSCDLSYEVICDFFHISPGVIKLLYSMKGCDKIIMISDAEVGAGMPDGEFVLENGQHIFVKNKQTTNSSGTICGGTTCLIDGVRNLVSIGIPLNEAVKTATKNPAVSVGIYSETGSITVGKTADILILDKKLNIKNVVLRGKPIY